ncbi:hypothetical protein PQR37_25475 [Paraburkholderia nemoris]|uniref:hypothetical protein n=1 Tax=Paraburkholderia nemoris TaxID=2793076 RepID=UPI0038B84F38
MSTNPCRQFDPAPFDRDAIVLGWKSRDAKVRSPSDDTERIAMHPDPVEYKTSTIMPLAPISMPGYAATAIVTHRNGKREAFAILGYFASESAACMFAIEYAKAHIDGRRRPKPPLSLR